MENLSPNVPYSEGVRSESAARAHLDNTPDERQLKNMKVTATTIIEALYARFGRSKISWTSFFRSAKLNHIIGGATNSQHVEGKAVDIYAVSGRGITNEDIFQWAIHNLNFDQIIKECPDAKGNPAWVHISYDSDKPTQRKQILIAFRKPEGGFRYEPYRGV